MSWNLIWFSDEFDSDVKNLYDFERSIEQYTSTGGTARMAILSQLSHFKSKYTLPSTD